jgi:thymidine kinase
MHTRNQARLQVVAGPMFAGKSEELLRRVRRARIAGLEVEVFSHALDDRRGEGHVSSHSGLSVSSRSVPDVDALLAAVRERSLDLVAVDEAQFFGPNLVAAVDALVADGLTVVVSGLCVTFDGRPFEPLPALMAIAEDVLKLTAVCAVCGEDAAFHQRISSDAASDPLVPTHAQVGGIESYQARCRRHFTGAVRHPDVEKRMPRP